MHSSGAVNEVKLLRQISVLSTAEMKIVEQAREESRKQAAALEQMKQYARAAFLSNPGATEIEFEYYWPELRSDMFRHQAHHGMLVYR